MPNSLQGLNIVYPPPRPSDNPGHDLLTPPPGFPDLSAQLDLWTNLSFASDEPFVDKQRKRSDINGLNILDQKLADGHDGKDVHEINEQGLIVNADKPTQTAIDNGIPSISPPTGHVASNGAQSSFDFGSFLAGFGIDPFLVPPQPSLGAQANISSLESLTKPSLPSPNDISSPTTPNTGSEAQPPTKRARTRKDSIASHVPAIAPSALQQRHVSSERAVSEFSEDHDPLSTPLTASEDKRRRNTAASARFRAKKKEREQALERRSKDLETKVNELERECEGLRRENGWLKGLVVGVTGANPSSVSKAPEAGGVDNETGKGKRKRDVEGNGD